MQRSRGARAGGAAGLQLLVGEEGAALLWRMQPPPSQALLQPWATAASSCKRGILHSFLTKDLHASAACQACMHRLHAMNPQVVQLQSSRARSPQGVTIVTQLSLERLGMLENQCRQAPPSPCLPSSSSNPPPLPPLLSSKALCPNGLGRRSPSNVRLPCRCPAGLLAEPAGAQSAHLSPAGAPPLLSPPPPLPLQSLQSVGGAHRRCAVCAAAAGPGVLS